MQDEFCTEYNLDLANSNVVNMAMIFLDKDIGRDDAFKRALASTAKFRVTDKCTSPLFKGNDVSLQHLNGEWVMIAQLDMESPYLKHEINDKCANRNYLPRTEVGLQIYSDKNPWNFSEEYFLKDFFHALCGLPLSTGWKLSFNAMIA